MTVYWYERAADTVPAEPDWLSLSEQERAGELRFPRRRGDWLLGRWTAKSAVADYLGLANTPQALGTIEIRATESGAPKAFVDGRPAPVEISLSHRNQIAACLIGPPASLLGCDLEWVEPRSDAFVADYLAASEQALVAQALPDDRDRLANLLWSAKESALKAMSTGLRLSSLSVVVSFPEVGRPQDEIGATPPRRSSEGASTNLAWRPLLVECPGDQSFRGWWQQEGRLLRTMVSSPLLS